MKQFDMNAPLPLDDRMKTLLEALAEDLENGQQPFNEQFLADNNVTYDELNDLTVLAAVSIRSFIKAPLYISINGFYNNNQ